MSDLHDLLRLQLESSEIDLDGERIDAAHLRRLLGLVSETYVEADDQQREFERLVSASASELAELNGALEETERVKAEFLACMSREIRNPMNGVLGMLQVLMTSTLTREQRECAETLQSSAQTLLAVLGDILELSRIDARELELDRRAFQLAPLVDEVANRFAQRAQEKGVELVTWLDPGLPRSVAGDSGRMCQVLENLVSNAVKFTDRGEILVHVAPAGEGRLCFEVLDTGIGIAREARERIFQAFVQVERTHASSYEGTGLGLAISKGLVELMGGTVGVESEPGRGSTFHVELALPAVEGPAREEPPFAGRRALVVAHSRQLRASLEAALSSLGFAVATRIDPQSTSAAEILAGGYDVILLDWDMPRGVVDLKDEIAEAPEPDRPRIVTLCPHGDPSIAEILGAFSGDGHLSKPVAGSELRECLASVLAGTEPRAPAASDSLAATARRVLLVDDNVVNRRVGMRMLARLGLGVDEASSGREALDLLERERFDLILLDCHLRCVDGLDVARAVRDQERAQGLLRRPIVAMTAADPQSELQRCREADMDDAVSKPVEPRELESALRRILDDLPSPARDRVI